MKTLLRILVILSVMLGGCAALLTYLLPDDLCATTVLDQILSPTGKLKAVVFQKDCGATTDFNSHVAIVAADVDVTRPDIALDTAFSADCGHDGAPRGKGGGPELRVRWLSDNELEIQHHALARVHIAETAQQHVAIRYSDFR